MGNWQWKWSSSRGGYWQVLQIRNPKGSCSYNYCSVHWPIFSLPYRWSKGPYSCLGISAGQFQKATWANKLALRRRLHSLCLKVSENIQDHIKAITEIFNELAVIGDNIEDKDKVVYLLAGFLNRMICWSQQWKPIQIYQTWKLSLNVCYMKNEKWRIKMPQHLNE